MKSLIKHIQESASIFDIGVGYDDIPTYTKYSEGDLKFGDVDAGDTLYYWDIYSDNIIELTATSKMKPYKGQQSPWKHNFVIDVKKTKEYNKEKVIVGAQYGLFSGGPEKQYNPDTVSKMSISIGLDRYRPSAMGTNRDTVLKLAKSNISEKIEDLSYNIWQTQQEIDKLKKRLDNML